MQGKDQRSKARDEREVPWGQENVRFPLFGTIHKGYGSLRTSKATIPFYIVDDRNIITHEATSKNIQLLQATTLSREYRTGHESYCSSANYG